MIFCNSSTRHLQLIRIYQSLQRISDKEAQAANHGLQPATCLMLTNLAAELCNAARRFMFEDCPKLAADALLRAQLLHLQVRRPMLPLLNAELRDIHELLLQLDNFNDAFILVRRYYSTTSPPMAIWGAPVFHHTVVNKNFAYFDDLRLTICDHLKVYPAVLERFLAHSNKMSVLDSFKKFLNMCGDILLRCVSCCFYFAVRFRSHLSSAELAAKGGFYPDIVQECKQVELLA